MVFSASCIADRYADSAHSESFQQLYGQVRSAPLDYTPSDLIYPHTLNTAIELAVLQHMQRLLRQSQLTADERHWIEQWQLGEVSHPTIPHLAQRLTTKAEVLTAVPNVSEWLLLPETKQLYWLSQAAFSACQEADFSALADTVLVAKVLRCQQAEALSDALARGERSATLPSLPKIPVIFDPSTAKKLLLEAAKNRDLAVVAMPILAQNFGADEDVQSLMVAGLYDEQIGAISAVSLAKYGSQQTLLELHRKLQLQQLDSPADRFAKVAIEQSGYLLEPLAAQLP
ncbi:hypothetical protein K0504_02775 [Neiella marina]|uniref:Uncharacterized protein n=1 Tax=Neiella holothuriorum TaxID=2870530 RepID=A0ABS7ECG9_9GAMM|nr:hypothetical protein [Neiella holothuriorum]MBW8189945.1 hypothetical protein [Neiella holothuriorum]